MSKKLRKLYLVLGPQIYLRSRADLAGTERVFINDLIYLSNKRDYNCRGFARTELHLKNLQSVWYPRSFVNFLRVFDGTPLVRRLFRWEEAAQFCAELFYVLQIILTSERDAVFLSYSFPLLSLLFPKRSICFFQAPPKLFFSALFASRYKKSYYLFCSEHLLLSSKKTYLALGDAPCTVVPNFVDRSIFKEVIKRKKLRNTTFLFASAWVKEKGFGLLLDAFLQLKTETLKKVTLIIASAPDLWYSDTTANSENYARVQMKKIEQLKKLGVLSLLGGVSQEKIARQLQNSDWFLFPSVWDEPFSMSVLEALSCGTPVIHFGVGGLTEVVDKDNSVLVRKKTSRAFSKLLQSISDGRVFRPEPPLWREKNNRMEKLARNSFFSSFLDFFFDTYVEDNPTVDS